MIVVIFTVSIFDSVLTGAHNLNKSHQQQSYLIVIEPWNQTAALSVLSQHTHTFYIQSHILIFPQNQNVYSSWPLLLITKVQVQRCCKMIHCFVTSVSRIQEMPNNQLTNEPSLITNHRPIRITFNASQPTIKCWTSKVN